MGAGAVDMLWEVVLGYPLVAFSGAWPIEANEHFVPLRRQLAQQMEAHKDMGVIIQAAVLSDAFWRGPDHEADSIDYPQLGTPAYFSYRYPKPSARLGVGESLAQLDQQLRSGTAPAGTFARIAQGIEAAAASGDKKKGRARG